jgi:Icc-related predicted phosphoesterase
MRFLAIGDFHGKFQKKWEKLIKKEKIDLVVSNGDYIPFSLAKVFFKHVYGQDKIELWDVVGKRKYKEQNAKDVASGESVVKKMNNLPVPVVTVTGNNDRTKWPEAIKEGYYTRVRKKWKWINQDFFTPVIAKYDNVNNIDYSSWKFGDYVFVGMANTSFPGKVKNNNYKRMRRWLEMLFMKHGKENRSRKLIFLSHNVPYNTRLDKITSKGAHKKAKGKHYGSKLVRRIIDKHQPLLHIGGHIHESLGKQKVGKTLCVNPGAAHEGKAAIVDISERGVINVKFVR